MKIWCGVNIGPVQWKFSSGFTKKLRLRTSFTLFHMHYIPLKNSVPKSMKETRECFLRFSLGFNKIYG